MKNSCRQNEFVSWKLIPLTIALVAIFIPIDARAQSQEVVWQQAGTGGNAVTFSSDGLLVLTGNQLRRASDGQLVQTFNNRRSGIISVALSPDGQFAAIGTQTNLLNLNFFRIADGTRIVPTNAHNNGTTTVKFSPDSQFLASGGRDGTVKLWHVPDMTLMNTFLGGPGYNARVFAVVFSLDGQFLAVGGQAGAKIIRVSDGALVHQLTDSGTVEALALSPDGQTLSGAFFTAPYAINFWRFSDGMTLKTIYANNQPLNALAYQPDGQVIASGGGDDSYSGIVRFFRVSDSTELGFFPQDPNNGSSYVTSIAYSPDGQLIAYARADQLTVVARNPFACRHELSSTSETFPAKGGSGTVTVSSCGAAWTAVSHADWITISERDEGFGDGTVSYSVESNMGKPRTGTITIDGIEFVINQDGFGRH
jgi:WD40 repeat protein